MMRSKEHIANEIVSSLQKHYEHMTLFLKKLVALESPSKSKDSQHALFQLLEKKFKELNYYTIRVKGKETGGYLYARPLQRQKNNPLQLLLGHCDTVWDLDTLKKFPIKQQNNKISGPGSYDMKAGLTQILYALLTLEELQLSAYLTPVVLINSDEEIGSIESTDAIKRLSKICNRAFVLEPPLGLDGRLKTARKGIGKFVITVKGKAAHAGLDPEKGANAIVELSHQVQQLYAMNDFEKGITVNVGLIQGGYSANVIAAESSAIVDVRVLNKNDGQYITDKIYSLKPIMPNVELKIEGGIGRQPMERTPRNQVLWRIAKTKGKLIGLRLKQGISGGGSDGNTTSLYTATLDGLGTTGDGAHADHEFIYADKLVERTALLTLLLLDEMVIAN
ncbi:MAG: M20 family metallopeptidase [Flavobacteriaceae bacterium]|nr:M20 family metallopeptidase [Flavobacteriaceae bacterium]